MSNVLVDLHNVVKSYSIQTGIRQRVLGPLDFSIREGEFVSIIGPSGCGKTTLLRILAGLESIDSGGHECCGSTTRGIPPDLGYVFQQNSLFPWLNALDNVAFGLRMKGTDHKTAHHLALQSLKQIGLHGSESKYPHQLSGGMRQKVAIARTMITQPRLLLLDEPFGAVDLHTRKSLDLELRQLQQETGVTAVLVTHDLEEALRVADRVLQLGGKPGKIIGQIDPRLPNAKHELEVMIRSEETP